MQREMWFYGSTYHYNFLRILNLSALSIMSLLIATQSNEIFLENNIHTTGNVCEWNSLSISCNDSIINIVQALYGRLDKVTCVGGRVTTEWSTNCLSSNATKVIQETCNNRTNCDLDPVNKTEYYNTLFGSDPCPGTSKYLYADYTCLPVPTTSAVGCRCLNDFRRNVTWPETECDSNANQSCPNNKRRHKALRQCSNMTSKGLWMHPNLLGCITEEIEAMRIETDAIKRNFSVDSTKEMMSRVKNISECNDLYGGDLYELTRIMVDLVKLSSQNITLLNYSEADNLTEMVLNSTGNLLSDVYNETWMDLPPGHRSQTAARLLDALETSCTVLAKTADSPKSIKKSVAGIELQINVFNITQTTSKTSATSFKTLGVEVDVNLEDVRKRSQEGNGTLGLGRTVFILYDDIAKWLYVDQSTSSKNDTSIKPSVISKVMSASIVSNDPKSTETPVRFTMHHQMRLSNSTIVSCVFWKFSENGAGGHWSKEGLRFVSSSSDNTTCESCHTTNFAILMSAVEIPKVHGFALQVITYVGCAISIVCLALALCTFCLFRNLQSDRNTIHKNLVFCLLVSELIFVFGITPHGKLLCAFVAGFLHYFLLASFAWMCLEGVQLYVLLIEVFEAEKSRVKWYYLAGYGIPALIVSISVSVNIYMKVMDLTNLKEDCTPDDNRSVYFKNKYGAYGTDNYCWLSLEQYFVWAFIGPALAIIAVNLVMLGVAIYTMWKHASSAAWKMKSKSKIYAMGSWLRGAAILVVLLGTTWCFGLGMLYESAQVVPMAYIFTVLNSLQGFFIFVFHCLVNEKVQTEFQRSVQRSTWLPENVKVKFGGGDETPSKSVTDRKPLYQRMFVRNKRKDSSSSVSHPKAVSTRFGHESLTQGNTASESCNLTESPGDEPQDSSAQGNTASESCNLTESPGDEPQDSSTQGNTASESGNLIESPDVEPQDSSCPLRITERQESSYSCSSERAKIRIPGGGTVQRQTSNTANV